MEVVERWGVFNGKHEKKDSICNRFILKLECKGMTEVTVLSKQRCEYKSDRETPLRKIGRLSGEEGVLEAEPQKIETGIFGFLPSYATSSYRAKHVRTVSAQI